METWHKGRLNNDQADHIARWLPHARLRSDLSWNLLDTVVFDVDSDHGRFVIKAGGPTNHHMGREIAAHQGFTECLARTGHAPQLIHYDRTSNLLVTRYLDGSLALGSESEFDSDIHRQAGTLARIFHNQAARISVDWNATAIAKSLAWLDKPNRIEPALIAKLRSILTTLRPGPVVVVPTHGDWQPRNWLVEEGIVKAIDFGRFDWRPAMTDFCRLAAKQWRDAPHLEDAFFAGYGTDPRLELADEWRTSNLHEAIATAVWAYQVGDERFEMQGHQMITDALTLS
ncbi:phosphotransferase [Rhodococcus globerulus]|uniref:Phosphotransferase n=1 Tax=Rhodococcus globerulus TaxID=33008 RepID=A0ABU4C2U0_RHOGO|nr:phosphotransferase [Rhodococcus globerulus]MDV6270817.1 phosphotransferase [Rhodococcus globerulus]